MTDLKIIFVFFFGQLVALIKELKGISVGVFATTLIFTTYWFTDTSPVIRLIEKGVWDKILLSFGYIPVALFLAGIGMSKSWLPEENNPKGLTKFVVLASIIYVGLVFLVLGTPLPILAALLIIQLWAVLYGATSRLSGIKSEDARGLTYLGRDFLVPLSNYALLLFLLMYSFLSLIGP